MEHILLLLTHMVSEIDILTHYNIETIYFPCDFAIHLHALIQKTIHWLSKYMLTLAATFMKVQLLTRASRSSGSSATLPVLQCIALVTWLLCAELSPRGTTARTKRGFLKIRADGNSISNKCPRQKEVFEPYRTGCPAYHTRQRSLDMV